MSQDKTRRIILASRPKGAPTPDNFRIEEAPIPALAEGQVLLETQFLSLDPYMRGRMDDAPSYAASVAVGEVMEGGTVAKILESKNPKFTVSDFVLAHSGWQSHQVTDGKGLRKLDPALAPISTALGVLGMPGFTAYAGLLTIGQPKAGETVVVAAASGPVGSAVGQIAKIKGARAVGIAGGADKCAYLRDELKFDAVVDHRAPDFAEQLKAACPKGIDVYFENVGGPLWDAVQPLLNNFARVPVCGLIANYNATSAPQGPDRSARLMRDILVKRLTIRGFIVFDFADKMPDFQREMPGWIANGSLRYREDIVQGLNAAPEAFIGLLEGRNFGKLLIKLV